MFGVIGFLLTLFSAVCAPAHVEPGGTWLPGTTFPIVWLGVIGYVLFTFWSLLFAAAAPSESFWAKMARFTHHLAGDDRGGLYALPHQPRHRAGQQLSRLLPDLRAEHGPAGSARHLLRPVATAAQAGFHFGRLMTKSPQPATGLGGSFFRYLNLKTSFIECAIQFVNVEVFINVFICCYDVPN